MPATVATRAERQAITRTELVDAASASSPARASTRRRSPPWARSLHDGTVYSNFASKEDLFFAVYERRAGRRCATSSGASGISASPRRSERLGMDTAARRGRDDGWLAVFLEFWAHVVRNQLHARFAEIHTRVEADRRRRATAHGRWRGPHDRVVTAAMNVIQIGSRSSG